MKTSDLETPKILNDFTNEWSTQAKKFYMDQIVMLDIRLRYTTKLVFDLYEKKKYSSLVLKAHSLIEVKRIELVDRFILRKQNRFLNGLKRLIEYHLGSELDWSGMRMMKSGSLYGIVKNDINGCVLVETIKIGGDNSVNYDYRYKVTVVPYDLKVDRLFNTKI